MSETRREGRGRPLWLRVLRLLLRWAFALAVLAILVGGAGFYYVYDKYGKDLPDISILEDYRPAEKTKILASDGTVIATLYLENRVWAPLDKMGKWLVPALLATEDSSYFEHKGVDPKGLARVVFNTARTGEVREGASTITMQLARLVFPLSEVNWERKIREIFLSLEIDKRYSKEKVLELYLNQVYFGAGAYGIHSAAQVYFHKSPEELTLSEAALIAGLIQAPSRFNPLEHPERAFHRQNEVLGRLKAVGSINEKQLKEAKKERSSWTFNAGDDQRNPTVDKFPYFTSYVISELAARYTEEQLYRGGLTIITTLDPKLQEESQRVLTEEVKAAAWSLRVDSGALVLIENDTGFIRSLVGGLGWSEKNQFNRAYQARRQPGSSFKPATYAAALEAGFTPESRINDKKVTYSDGSPGGWTPKNSDGQYLGVITLRQALRGSRNIPVIKILEKVGIERVIDLGYRMGIKAPIPQNLSIALGAIDANPLEMAEFYSVIINRGVRINPTAVKLVKDSSGKILEDRSSPTGSRVFRKDTSVALISMLTDVVRSGTGTRAQVSGWPIAGKTGTTDSFRDAWFCGFSPHYTLSVWVGNDDNSPMYRSYGGDLPAIVFRRVMTFALKGKRKLGFPHYDPAKRSKDLLAPGETPTPTPSVSASPSPKESPVDEETGTPLENQESGGPDDPVAKPTPAWTPPEGQSYLLPETIEASPQPKADLPEMVPAPLPEPVVPAAEPVQVESEAVELPPPPPVAEPVPPAPPETPAYVPDPEPLEEIPTPQSSQNAPEPEWDVPPPPTEVVLPGSE